MVPPVKDNSHSHSNGLLLHSGFRGDSRIVVVTSCTCSTPDDANKARECASHPFNPATVPMSSGFPYWTKVQYLTRWMFCYEIEIAHCDAASIE